MRVHSPGFAIACAGLILLIAGTPLRAQDRAPDRAAPFETSAKQVLLYDFATRSVLFEREADRRIAPTSLAKLMNVALVFREIREGRLSPENDMVVSVDAWRRGGAVSGNPNMLLTPNKVVKVGDLLTGLIVGGANDAALTFAENIAGREDRFVEMMNGEARALGLSNTVFRNATGYAAEGQVSTLRDLVTLAAHLIETYPEQYALFAQRDFPLGRNRQVSRNPLLTMEIGADGLMTGYLPETGQALVGSAVQEGRRVILAAAGFESVQERALESRKLIEWAFRRFEIRTLFPAGAEIGTVSVYGGETISVGARTAREIRLPALRGTNEGMVLRLAYLGPVPSPVKAGDTIARLEIWIDNRLVQTAPLVASQDVARGGTIARARDAALEASRQIARGGIAWFLDRFRSRRNDGEAKPAGSAG
jgi:D-alanyl-D-alanine carboxypeptidase (penicillin-binding protein 5/6)